MERGWDLARGTGSSAPRRPSGPPQEPIALDIDTKIKQLKAERSAQDAVDDDESRPGSLDLSSQRARLRYVSSGPTNRDAAESNLGGVQLGDSGPAQDGSRGEDFCQEDGGGCGSRGKGRGKGMEEIDSIVASSFVSALPCTAPPLSSCFPKTEVPATQGPPAVEYGVTSAPSAVDKAPGSLTGSDQCPLGIRTGLLFTKTPGKERGKQAAGEVESEIESIFSPHTRLAILRLRADAPTECEKDNGIEGSGWTGRTRSVPEARADPERSASKNSARILHVTKASKPLHKHDAICNWSTDSSSAQLFHADIYGAEVSVEQPSPGTDNVLVASQ